ncbi:MAG TPA: family 16 glycoside hydrolase [Verrucomicrobiae bacterium]|jgi:hypothetical protein
MKLTRIILSAAFAFAFSANRGHAEKAATLTPILAKPGKVVVEENFDGAQLAKSWVANKGDWQIKDGVLVGKEKKSDNHAAVLLLDKPGRNSIIQFSFKLDGAKSFNLSYNSAKGHMFRIVISPTGLTINKDKDKKDAKSQSLALGKAAGKFEAGKWHSMLVEVKGDKVSVQADNGAKAEGSHRELDVDKTGYRFVTSGESLAVDDVKVWQTE